MTSARSSHCAHGSAIPPNLIAVPNTESNSYYLRYCRQQGMVPHPARFPYAIPEYFIRMLTDPGEFVVDPFAGSCVTGEVAERLRRNWACCDLIEDYLRGSLARFTTLNPDAPAQQTLFPVGEKRTGENSYRVNHPGSLWNGNTEDQLRSDGGRNQVTPVRRRRKSQPTGD